MIAIREVTKYPIVDDGRANNGAKSVVDKTVIKSVTVCSDLMTTAATMSGFHSHRRGFVSIYRSNNERRRKQPAETAATATGMRRFPRIRAAIAGLPIEQVPIQTEREV
jgi:hypothetical protein